MCDGLKMGRRVENVANVEKMQKIEKNQKKLLTFPQICIILTYVIEAWLSLVERCVRDAEVAGSNPVASTNSLRIPWLRDSFLCLYILELFSVDGMISLDLHIY